MTYRGYSKEQIAATLEHTVLKPEATKEDVVKNAQLAQQTGCAAYVVAGINLSAAASVGGWGETALCSVIGFPHANVSRHILAEEAVEAVKNGVKEIDMVFPLGKYRSGEVDAVRRYIEIVCEVAHANNATVKVILETASLSDDEIVEGCKISEAAGADFVKTSTGYGSGGATVEAIRLMRQTVGDRLGVKASGGVRTLDAAIDMLEAGANRIGTSNTLGILAEFETK